MKLHNLLYGIAFASGLIGFAGLAGYIEQGTGLLISIVLIAICIISVVLGAKKEVILQQKK